MTGPQKLDVRALPPFLTVAQAAELASVSKDTVRRMIARGEIDAVKFGRLLRIRTESFLNAGRPIRAWLTPPGAATDCPCG